MNGADTYYNAGNVGIGTATPIAGLHVVGDGVGTVMRLTNGGSGGGTALIATGVFGFGKAASFYGATTNDLISVWNDGSGKAAAFHGDVTFNSGKVGIGVSTPFHTLHVESGNALTAINARNTASTGVTYGVHGRSDSASGRGILGFASAFSGTTSGVYGRSDSSSGRGVYGVTTNSGTTYGVVGQSNSSSGFDFFAQGAGTNYGAASSRRWKHNVEPISDPLSKLAQLRGVYFDWDDEHGGHHDVGMIAEEVGKVLPEIVNYEENGVDAIGMDYSKMTPLLVEAVNALRAEKDAEIAQQQAQIADLTARLERLERLIAKK